MRNKLTDDFNPNLIKTDSFTSKRGDIIFFTYGVRKSLLLKK